MLSFLSKSDFSEGDRFTRLNTTNFYDMFKIMLQMEDEIGSKRVMSHDQYDQQVKYECEKRYSMKIVISVLFSKM